MEFCDMGGAPKEIKELVKRFEQNLEAYKRQGYNETQIRREFIDPFFEALGWDVANKQGHAEPYKDVIHEDAIKVGGGTKAPDYCFRIGGTRKFFLEAKKPSVDIGGDTGPAYQLRRYAWSAKLPLSILTDFEEFAVYDCQVKPQHTAPASTARIILLGYKDYVERWDEISQIFSKDAILKGSFDKFAAKAGGKRGTSTVDKEFLKEIESWRKNLATYIARQNRDLGTAEVNFAVQRIIDRILFLRMCEDRGIEPYGQLMTVKNGRDVYRRLGELFEKADAKYNSGLFYFKYEKGRNEPPDELTLGLTIPDEPVSWILHNLYYPQSPYEFSVLPAEILGNVYEQFLGKVIRITPGRVVKIEDKPEVKKAGGVYYTPEYIVDYIVKNTVGKLCEGKTPKEISKLRIVDPACGSGSFLLGAYTYLLNYHQDWYLKNEPEKYTKQIYRGKGGKWYLTITEKKRILLDNIYGVDIDYQAVEVTKLSLLLKVLEGESQETVQQVFRIFHERALPDLGNNIKCGNSLIGTDFYEMPEGEKLAEEEKKRINAFEWEKEFPDIFVGKNGGFDVVIGNPPWGSLLTNIEKKYLYDRYINRRGEAESHLFFVERACRMIKNSGIVGFITPNTWLSVQNSKETRDFLLTKAAFREISQLSKYIFIDAPDITPILVFLSKGVPETNLCTVRTTREIHVSSSNFERVFTSEQIPQNLWATSKASTINLYATPSILKVVKKCNSSAIPLSQISSVFYGIKTGNNKKFLSSILTAKHKSKALKTGELTRYNISWRGLYLWWSPALAGYRKSSLEVPKIIVQYIRKISLQRRIIAAIDSKGLYYPLNNYSCIKKKDKRYSLEYTLGLLNSSLMNFYFAKSFTDYNIKPTYLKQLPIRTIDFDNAAEKRKHDKMVKLVERMLELNNKMGEAKVPDEKVRLEREIGATDKQIDFLVYELYGLSAAEIAIIEGVEGHSKTD